MYFLVSASPLKAIISIFLIKNLFKGAFDMNKKKIVSTTVMFVLIIGATLLFKSIFGATNALVAVTGITSALSLLGTDYTINPIKNTIYFVCLEVIIGIAAFLSSLNALLGLIVTFCIVFYILYNFTYIHKKPTYFGFTLGYFFMLYTPISLAQLPMRLLGLAVCGVAIMLLQLLFNRNLIQKQTNGRLKSALGAIKEEVSLIDSKCDLQELSKLNQTTHATIKSLLSTLYEYIDRGAKLPILFLQELFIGHFLDSINIQLLELTKSGDLSTVTINNALSDLMHHVELFIEGQMNLEHLLEAVDSFLTSTDFAKSKNYFDFQLNIAANTLKKDLLNTRDQELSNIYNQYFIPNLMDRLTSFKNNIHRDSLKFTFACRCALVTCLGVFIVNAFHIEDGRWIIFSLHAIIQPYSDYSKAKGQKRLIGTIIGLVIFEVLFSIFRDVTTRTLIMLIVSYLSNYSTDYKYQVIGMTVSALGAASIGGNMDLLAIERLIYVVSGTVIALCANKFVLPYRINDATKTSLDYSINLNEKVMSMLYEKCIGSPVSNQEFNTLVNINQFVNKKIEFNNTLIQSIDLSDYVYSQHVFMNDIRIVSSGYLDAKKGSPSQLKLLKQLDYLSNQTLSQKDILQYIEQIDDLLNQLILISMLKIKENISTSKELAKRIKNAI